MLYDRVLIIVWKWSELERKVGDEVFDTFKTTGKNKDLIIRINELKSPKAIERLYKFISKHQTAKILLFLHREHDYNGKDIQTILENTEIQNSKYWLKCFLFTGGTDFIYYNSKNEGLLDGMGEFMNGSFRESYIDENGRKKYKPSRFVSVLSDDETMVVDKHFERVWAHYEFEFKKKISKLKVDFLSYFVEVPSKNNNETEIACQDWLNRLTQNRLLHLRIRSFLGVYDKDVLDKEGSKFVKKHTAEIKELQEKEKIDQLSYHFDDCNANLEKMQGGNSAEFYGLLCRNLTPIFVEEKCDLEATISLTTIQQLFNKLIKTIK